MAKLELSSQKTPSVADFQATLHETMSTANLTDDQLILAEKLHAYERQHNMPSPVFFAAYEQGELPYSLTHEVAWDGTYDMFLRLNAIENTI